MGYIMEKSKISINTLNRLPMYLNILRSLEIQGFNMVSAKQISDLINQSEISVRKDLQFISSSSGKPNQGRVTSQLIDDIERFLGYKDTTKAVLIGVGMLGKALLSYQGFSAYGLKIVLAFDVNNDLHHQKISETPILPMEKLKEMVSRLKIHIGIITVPSAFAQEVCQQLIDAGIKAIWNFAPVYLIAPTYMIIHNEDMAYSFSAISLKLKEKI